MKTNDFRDGDPVVFITADWDRADASGRRIELPVGTKATIDGRNHSDTATVVGVRLESGVRVTAWVDRLGHRRVEPEPETFETSIESTHALQVGDVVVRAETNAAWPRVKRLKPEAPKPELPTANGSVVGPDDGRDKSRAHRHDGDWYFQSGLKTDPTTWPVGWRVIYDPTKED